MTNPASPEPTGFARLRTASDLLRKLQADRERLQKNPIDDYAAFDFVVTAAHFKQWLDADWRNRPQGASVPSLQWEWARAICFDIADRAKHFNHRGEVLAVAKFKGGFDPRAFSDGWSRAALLIELPRPQEREAALAAGLRLVPRDKDGPAHYIRVLDFEEWVVGFWERWYADAERAT
jgi:hypothetical protein